MRNADPDRVVRDVGRRVAELRAQEGLTQAELAEAAGVSVKYLQRIEAGGCNLTIRSLVRLASVLGTSAADLFSQPASRERRRGRPPKKAG